MNFHIPLAWFMKWNKTGPCVVLVAFSEGVKWDLGPIFQLPCGKVLAQVGPLNMVLLRSIWSIATTLYNNSSFWSWPIASISTTWVSLKSDTLAWVFNHAVWGLGAGSRGKKRWRDRCKEGGREWKRLQWQRQSELELWWNNPVCELREQAKISRSNRTEAPWWPGEVS